MCNSNRSYKNSQQVLCVSQEPYNEDNDAIDCDDENSLYVWLHFKCIKLISVPKGSYCKHCRCKRQKEAKEASKEAHIF